MELLWQFKGSFDQQMGELNTTQDHEASILYSDHEKIFL
jgi:hypothetical protein